MSLLYEMLWELYYHVKKYSMICLKSTILEIHHLNLWVSLRVIFEGLGVQMMPKHPAGKDCSPQHPFLWTWRTCESWTWTSLRWPCGAGSRWTGWPGAEGLPHLLPPPPLLPAWAARQSPPLIPPAHYTSPSPLPHPGRHTEVIMHGTIFLARILENGCPKLGFIKILAAKYSKRNNIVNLQPYGYIFLIRNWVINFK